MSFHVSTAIRCAKAIQALYADPSLAPIVDKATDTQCRVERISDDDRWDIILPGSATLRDWLTNAQVRKTRTGYGNIHRGFHNAAHAIFDEIEDALPPYARVLITGHSLGGALATIIARWLATHHHSFKIEGVYTFGSPRVGNSEFAQQYNLFLQARTFRVVNAGDPVPHVPWVFGTYRHVNTQVYLSRDGQAVIDQPMVAVMGELKETLATSLNTYANPATALTLAEPHNLSAYVKRLEALA